MYEVKLSVEFVELGKFQFKNIEMAARFVEFALETYAGEKEIKAELTRVKDKAKEAVVNQ